MKFLQKDLFWRRTDSNRGCEVCQALALGPFRIAGPGEASGTFVPFHLSLVEMADQESLYQSSIAFVLAHHALFTQSRDKSTMNAVSYSCGS